MDKPIDVDFATLEVAKLHKYETYYDKLQPHFGRTQCHYIDTDAFVLSLNTKNFIEGLKNLEDLFDFQQFE